MKRVFQSRDTSTWKHAWDIMVVGSAELIISIYTNENTLTSMKQGKLNMYYWQGVFWGKPHLPGCGKFLYSPYVKTFKQHTISCIHKLTLKIFVLSLLVPMPPFSTSPGHRPLCHRTYWVLDTDNSVVLWGIFWFSGKVMLTTWQG